MTTAEAQADMKAQVEKMKAELLAKAKEVRGVMPTVVAKACNMVQTSAKMNIKNATINTSVSYGRRKHHPSMPGSAPASDYGTLINSISHSVEVSDGGSTVLGKVGSVITNPPYPVYLEDGTSLISPRPWLKPALEANKEKIKELFGKLVEGRTVNIDIGDSNA